MTRKPMVSPSPTGSTVSVPPRGMVCPPIISMLSSSLTRFFGSSTRGRFQVSLVFSSSMKPRAIFSASPRSICAPAEPAAPNASRQNCKRAEAVAGALLDEVERECLGLLVLVLLEHLEAVDDRADRADQVVADARAQERREIEGFEGERRRTWRSPVAWQFAERRQALALERRVPGTDVIHRGSLICQGE